MGSCLRILPGPATTVLEDSLAKALKMGLGTALLAPWYDVDTPDDLLRPELIEKNNGAERTRDFLLDEVPPPAYFKTSN